MLRAGLAHGMTAAECLAGTGLTESALTDENCEIWAHQEFDIIRNVIAHLGDRPGVGIETGQASTIGRAGLLGLMMLTGPTLHEAIDRVLPYLALSPTHLRFSLETADEHVYLIADDSELPAGVRPFIVERDLAGLWSALRGAQIELTPLWIDTTLDPERAALLATSLGLEPAEVHPDRSRNRIACPRWLLDRVLPQADANTARMLEAQCRSLLDRRLARVGVAGQVRSRLLHHPGDLPSMQTVARELHMDPRTLRRRLTAEGTSFRDLLAQIRHRLAVELLAQDMRLDEIARRLGYAETANFTHAFIRWEGMAPSYFRKSVLGDHRVR